MAFTHVALVAVVLVVISRIVKVVSCCRWSEGWILIFKSWFTTVDMSWGMQ